MKGLREEGADGELGASWSGGGDVRDNDLMTPDSIKIGG